MVEISSIDHYLRQDTELVVSSILDSLFLHVRMMLVSTSVIKIF